MRKTDRRAMRERRGLQGALCATPDAFDILYCYSLAAEHSPQVRQTSVLYIE